MQKIRIQCGHCSTRLAVPESAVGKKIRCPKCQAIVVVTVNNTDEGTDENPELTDSDAPISEQDSPKVVPASKLAAHIDSVVANWLSEKPANAAKQNRSQISPSLHMPQSTRNHSDEGNEGKKKCPMCAELIERSARVCKFCRFDLVSVPVISSSSTPHRQLSKGVSSDPDTRFRKLSKEECSPTPVQQYEDESYPYTLVISKVAFLVGIVFLICVFPPKGGGDSSNAPADRASYGQAEPARPTNASAFDPVSDYTKFINSELDRLSNVRFRGGKIDVLKTESLVSPLVGTYKVTAFCSQDIVTGDRVLVEYETEITHGRQGDKWVMTSGKVKQVGWSVLSGDKSLMDEVFKRFNGRVTEFSSFDDLEALQEVRIEK
jgi:phage FluMu protein Com